MTTGKTSFASLGYDDMTDYEANTRLENLDQIYEHP